MAENGKFTPEEIVKATTKGMVEAGSVILPPVKHVAKAALPAGTWLLDEMVKMIPLIRRASPYTTQKWRATARYGKEEKHGS